ncbi:MAG: ATP-binding cassette domain-containing protein [Alphaproteobacteria bacterium]|jgi:ATPase subunit of ABC transporter with duplicated ATPase domains|nr:ATP-binding cassette domain-containing protein [Alphaproteobacteria bacterium]MBU2041006.1 ATP-binding cassette domain-containing protein [Alphaproteobacteria bacterium]MBU2127109.1 ATP-binding cassette domain-containing protein [Alphaproteobacteria bacterium]MBU2207851.1 ATP-binding cassette domain-containing protein [Alphaproteobacteria bacterium]MBU2289561.1 ATP-binding cassette domain-containing protein [Alphaproteobacteria bacterium]
MSFSSLVPSPSPSALVTLDRVAARTADGPTLFSDLSLAFGRERTGVVGRNGVGKTTLLRLIAGLSEPGDGTVMRAGRVGFLQQAVGSPADAAVPDALGVAGGLQTIARVLAGMGTADDLAEADWTLEDRIADALVEVGLAGLDPRRSIRSLSGGEQTRLRLAALLLDTPDLLVLDEPTNHLDREGRAIVAGVLERWKGGAVVVSHDRSLLRRMDRIVELSSLGAAVYGGGYDLYAERKAAERAAAEQGLESAERDAGRVARETRSAVEKKARRDKAGRAFAARKSEPKILLGAMAERAENSGARENRLAQRRAAEAEAVLTGARERVERVRALDIPLPPTGLASGRAVASLLDATWDAPDGRRIVGPVSLRLTGPERVAVAGPNGAGKTTLLRLLSGDLTPSSGRVERTAQAALLDQEAALLRPDETLIEAYRRLNPAATANAAQAALARFLFRNAAAQRVVGTLSGGERLRAGLACVMTGERPPQLLILDEPTNHLDLESIAAVEAALSAWDGALVVVSHDDEFLAAVGVGRTLRLV